MRKFSYVSEKNGGKQIPCLSKYELIACEKLENDDDVVGYESHAVYHIGGEQQSADFLAHCKGGSLKAINVMSAKRLSDRKHLVGDNSSDSKGWSVEVWTEKELGITKESKT